MSDQILAHRYHAVRTLGQGGMGQVWLAEDAIAGGTVAVKVLADVLRVTGKYDEALPLYREAIAIWEAEAATACPVLVMA